MGIKRYNVSLDENVVISARDELFPQEKLSPVINELLKKWTKERKEDGRV